MGKFDIDKIKLENSLQDVIGSYVSLTQNGREFEACCPFHEEKTPSFRVVPEKDFYHCFGCGEHGDVIDFVMEFNTVDMPTACKILGGESETPNTKTRKSRAKKVIKSTYDGIEPITPVPESSPLISKGKKTPEIYNPKRSNDPDRYKTIYKPNMVFPYMNAEGMLIGYVLRINFKDGAKITPTIMWCKFPDGSDGWCHYAFPEPRSLYGINLIKLRPDAALMIVEGEKCADAVHRLLPNYIPLSWPGSTNSIDKVDWTPVQGRRVTIWSDADEVGEKTAILIAGKCIDVGASEAKIIGRDKNKPKGWDAADAEDEGMSRDEIIKWAKEHVIKWPSEEEPPVQELEEEEPAENRAVKKIDEENPYFRMLGHRKENFYYYNLQTSTVIELSVAAHTKNQLMYLAPLSYWDISYPKGSGFDVDAAANSLIQRGKIMPMFKGNEMVRGRGAWIDGDNTVLHLGTKLNIDGEVMSLKDFKGLYLYDQDSDLNIPTAKASSTKEAHKLVDICSRLTWENPLSAMLLAGWCVIAPVCGILSWRPHIWVTGPSGSGKTTVVKDIIGRVLGEMAIPIEGNTSEAGIRQRINKDARPIIYDEAEPDEKNQSQHMKQILSMARVSSSGGQVLKGTSGGEGLAYTIRSCFCFSSINTSVDNYADESRISKLILMKDETDDADERFKELRNDMFRIFTPSFSAEMLSRSITHLKILKENCHTFVEAAARVLKSRRLADQIGNILAGAYLCHSNKVISLAEAVEWVSKHDWSDHTAIYTKTDERKLIDKICTYRARTYHGRGSQEVTIGELIICCDTGQDVGEISSEHAEAELKRYGVKVEDGRVYIANKSEPLKKLLSGTPWASDWGRPLKSLPEAESTDPMYFTAGITARATILQIALFKGEMEDEFDEDKPPF